MKPIYDSWDLSYKSIFGAIRQFTTCTFSIRLPNDIRLDFPPVLVFFRTGFKERFLTMHLNIEEDECSVYSCEYTPMYSDVHYYYFAYISDGMRHYIKKVNCHEGTDQNGTLFQLTVYNKDFETPDFLKGGVMYQIFPDRFCKSGKLHENIPDGRVIRDEWYGTPFYNADHNGRVCNNDYFGGDFEGIKSKLKYLKNLGVTCIYLNPIFESHENHRYNTADYMKADPLLGTNDEFEELCEEAKKNGIAIIIDGVFSHTGADSRYFNKFGRYKDELGAYQSTKSKYYEWYSFTNYPNEYESWWGIDTLPNVNENNKNYTEFICGEEGVLHYWLRKGATGFRLDVADELPDQFLEKVRKSVKNFGNDKVIIGEVWEDASNKESYGVKRRYLLGDQLDSVMNYPFREAIINFVKGGTIKKFIYSIMTIIENYPKPAIDVLMNFISTHDIERAINCLGGEYCNDKSKEWMADRFLSKKQYEHGKNLLKVAMALIFFMPGVPSIYYGDEAGLQGYKDPFNRLCYPWGHEDLELISYVQKISKVRKSVPTLKNGKIYFELNFNYESILFFARQGEIDYLFFINRTGEDVIMSNIPDMLSNFTDFHGFLGKFENNCLIISAYGYAIVKAKFKSKN